MIQTDILQTVFAVKGLNVLLSAFAADGSAQQKLDALQTRINNNNYRGIVLKQMTAKLTAAQAAATQAAAEAELAFSGVLAGVGVAALGSIISGLQEAVQSYVEFGAQVMNLRDLTGASARESVEAAELFRIAGVRDQQAMRETIKIAKDLASAKGNVGLGMLGISPQAGENSIHLLGRITDALNRIPPGLQRTEAAEEIFGSRGVQAILPLLRMTEAQRDAVKDLADSFNSDGLDAVQQFQFATSLLGETIMVKLVYPLAQALLPSIIMVTDALTRFIGWVGNLNQQTHGLLAMAVAFGAIGLAVGTVIAVIPPLLAALRSVALVEAVMDALAGNWANLAIGAAIGIGGGLIIGGLGSAQSENTSALNANTESNMRVAGAMNRFNDNWQQSNRGGIPTGLQRGDIAELARQRALGIIG